MPHLVELHIFLQIIGRKKKYIMQAKCPSGRNFIFFYDVPNLEK